MRVVALSAAFIFAVFIAAGCTGGPGNSVPASGPGASSNATIAAQPSIAHPPAKKSNPLCESWCIPRVIAPLAFDGTNFSIPSMRSCWDIFNAPAYRAQSSGPLALNGPVDLPATCTNAAGSKAVRKHGAPNWGEALQQEFYIVAIQVPTWMGGHDDVARRISKSPADFGENVALIAGPVDPSASSWSFAPLSPGLNMQAGASYVFYVIALCVPAPTPAPAPTPPPATFSLVAPLAFTGASFQIPDLFNTNGCGNVGTGSAPPFTARGSGNFTLGVALVSLVPTCAPSVDEGLYVIAVQAGSSAGGGTVQGWPVAGPADSLSAPWVFTPTPGTFVTQAGTSYSFFIGALAGGK